MKKIQKLKIIQEELESYFPNPQIPLFHLDPYTLLIAVLLSAQTTDRAVNLVTEVLFKKATTPEEMTTLGEMKIKEVIKTIGLAPKKAKFIVELSKILIEKHHGKVPSTFEELEALPGVGHKTASVVLVQAFGKEAFPVDTHIHRLAKRWGLSFGKNVKETEVDLKKFFPKESWGKVHLQLVLFGRNFCKAKGHSIENCPICSKLLP